MSRTFLVVDDHQLYRSAFCSLLELCHPDATIIEATNASQALALFPLHAWDVIILDYQLPTLSGSDIARHLRSQARAQGRTLPPLIMMSTQPDAATFARAVGAVAFLPKPVELAELLQVLAEIAAAPVAETPPATKPLHRTPPLASGQAQVVRSRAVVLRNEILQLLHQTMRRFPPPNPAVRTLPNNTPNTRVGDYLVNLGYLTPAQLTRVVRTISPQPSRSRVPLGFTVVARDLVPAPVVSAILLQQFRDRLAQNPAATPRFIGEQLLLQGQLTTTQLAWALQEQLDQHRLGQWVRLSEIIIQHGWRDPSEPETPLDLLPAR